MDFATWFRRWLARHPLKEPGEHDPGRFTAEVMARVREVAPAPVRARPPAWFQQVWGRWALAAVAAAVLAVVVLRVVPRPEAQVARETPVQTVQPLASLPKSPGSGAPGTLTLAASEKVEDDASWLEGTVELLEALEEDPEDGTAASPQGSDEEWLQEIESIDDAELAAASS